MSEQIARQFHDVYERLALQFGYETREDTKVFDPQSKNGRLMIAVCAEVIGEIERERDEIAALVRRLFQLLETVEVSDSEREFHPTRIQSCRVMHTIELGELLPKLKEAAK